MSWIRVVDESEATGQLKEIYRGTKKQRGAISNIMKIQSLNSKTMEAYMDLYLPLIFGESGLSREGCNFRSKERFVNKGEEYAGLSNVLFKIGKYQETG